MTSAPAIDPRRWRTDVLAFLTDVLRLPDGRSYGAALDDWQREDLAAAADGGNCWWERPRGHSKTLDAAALALHHIITTPNARGYFTAVDRDQAALGMDSLAAFVAGSPLLESTLKVDRWRVTAPTIGAQIEALSADAASSWGLRPSLLIVDELAAWRGDGATEFWESLSSSLGKVRGARMLVATTAGWDRTSLAWKLRGIVEHDPGWTFRRRGQCASWIDPAFLDQQRRLLPDHVYRRLHLNEWTEAGGAWLTHREVESIFDADRRPRVDCDIEAHWMFIDLGTSHDATAIAIIHRRDDMFEVDAIGTWRGSPDDRVHLGDVKHWVLDASQRFTGLRVIADAAQAIRLVEELVAEGLAAEAKHITTSYREKLFTTALQLVRSGRLRSFPHEMLRDELLRMEWRTVAGRSPRVDHPTGGHDDHVFAVVGAALEAMDEAAKPRRPPLEFWGGGPYDDKLVVGPTAEEIMQGGGMWGGGGGGPPSRFGI
jgi:hypothetical protein